MRSGGPPALPAENNLTRRRVSFTLFFANARSPFFPQTAFTVVVVKNARVSPDKPAAVLVCVLQRE